jgi:clan AA aspartic protease
MISGVVNSRKEAIISLSVVDSLGNEHIIQAVIDTGYAGSITLPAAQVNNLGLSIIGGGQLILANGSEITADICQATISWDGVERLVVVDTLETDPLIGMALLEGYLLKIQAVIGGNVEIELLPPMELNPPTTL